MADTDTVKLQNVIDHVVHITALRGLLVAVVKGHPEKEAVLAHFQRVMDQISERLHDLARPGAPQADEVFARYAQASGLDPDAIAGGSAHLAQLAERLQTYVEGLLRECQ